jgi:hypothetical protein
MTITDTAVPDPVEAFTVLREIAEDAASRGRLAFAASAKPLMRQRLGYDEVALDYVTFRELLLAAEQAGFLKLKYVLGGDVELTPGDRSTNAAATTMTNRSAAEEVREPERTEQRVFIRPDFWQTFVNPGSWWYDPGADVVVTATSASGRSDLIQMPRFDDDEQNAWVEEFVGTLPAPRRQALGPALANAGTAASKTSLMRGQPQTVRSHWFDFVSVKVAAQFDVWKNKNGLSVRTEAPSRPPRKEAPRVSGGRSAEGGPNREDLVRERLHLAIDRMPLSDLLRVSVPVEFLIEG